MDKLLEKLPMELTDTKSLRHVVIQHPTEEWILSSLPERLSATLHGKRWSKDQQEHLQSLIAQAQRMRNAAQAIVGDGRGDPLTASPSKLLATPLRKRSQRDAADETLQLERTVMQRAMMQCDLYLPQPPTSSTLAFLLKHHRIPAVYADRIAEESPGGVQGLMRLFEDLIDSELPATAMSSRHNTSGEERVDSTYDVDDGTLATLLLMDASTTSIVSSIGSKENKNKGTASLVPSKKIYFYHDGTGINSRARESNSLKKQILYENIAKAVDSSKLQIEPNWLKRATAQGRPCPAALFNATSFARETQLRVSAVEDVIAVIENRKRHASHLQQRNLLKPLSPVDEMHHKQPMYSPLSKAERDRCDTAWHDHPFYVFLDEDDVKEEAEIEKEKRAKLASSGSLDFHVARSLSRYASVIQGHGAMFNKHHLRLEEEALDWTSSGPMARSDAEQKYLAIQLVKEQQHAIYEKIRQNIDNRTRSPLGKHKDVPSPAKVSLRLAELSAPRNTSPPPVIPFFKEHELEIAKHQANEQLVTSNARHVTLPVFLNIRSFA